MLVKISTKGNYLSRRDDAPHDGRVFRWGLDSTDTLHVIKNGQESGLSCFRIFEHPF